jgi:hypothetical protein
MNANMRNLCAVVVLTAGTALAWAEGADRDFVNFGGGRYTLSFEDQGEDENGDHGDGLAEFTLPGETVEDWSKLVAFHSYPDMGDDPLAAVEALGKVVKAKNKDANYAIVANDKTGEAIIDFLTWEPESDVLEFNVFKYARAADGRGLVAMQYAEHVHPGDTDAAAMRALRKRAVADMAAADLSQAKAYFTFKQRYSASNAEEVEEPSRARASLDN